MSYREDLVLAAFAVSLGYKLAPSGKPPVAFSPDIFSDDGIPANGLSFVLFNAEQQESVTVWDTARGWRVGALIDGHYERPTDDQFFKSLIYALHAGVKRWKELSRGAG